MLHKTPAYAVSDVLNKFVYWYDWFRMSEETQGKLFPMLLKTTEQNEAVPAEGWVIAN